MTDFESVSSVLRSERFRMIAEGFDRRPLIHEANSIGPAMRLLHWQCLQDLGRLPSFDEGLANDAISGINRFGAPVVEVFMVSHRWLRPSLDAGRSHPDDADNTKTKALNEFTQWRRNWVKRKHGFEPEIFYWLDCCCFDQRDVANNLPMLPLWVACCERILRYETNDYHDRAWCRLELLLSHTFAFADHHVAISGGFLASKTGDGVEKQSTLLAPTEGHVTVGADTASIASLERFTCEFEPVAIDRSTGQRLTRATFGETTVKCYKL